MNESECVILCPGQGAQSVGMGRAWCESSPEAAGIWARADAVLSQTLDRPLSELCFEGPLETLNRTDVSQPAILACSVACWHGLKAAGEVGPIHAAAGLSLGEYTALHLAGAMSFEDALRVVAARGRLMQEAADASTGGMVALIGADEAQAKALCEATLAACGEHDVLVPANFNTIGQIVLSGSQTACEVALEQAAEAGLRAKALVVAGAFHSPLMQPAADRMAEVLENVEFSTPDIAVWSNVTGLPHESEPAQIKQQLIAQITHPVRWAQSLQNMLASGCSGFRELAPGTVLKGLMKRIDRKMEVRNHDAPDPSIHA